MPIELSEDRMEFVRWLVDCGQFSSEREVVEEALRLLEKRDDEAKLQDLRREIAIGIEQLDRGESVPCDPYATLARVRARRAQQAIKNDPKV